jgi:glucose/arabinose dehydrogenase
MKRKKKMSALLALFITMTVFAGISCRREQNERNAETPGELLPSAVTELTTGLDSPWDIVFLPDRTALISSRVTARIYRVNERGGSPVVIGTVPGVSVSAEGGLLGLAVSPQFEHDRTIYASISSSPTNRIVALHVAQDFRLLTVDRVILSGIRTADRHHGGRIKFGPDGNLWIGTGDSFNAELAPDPGSLNGKILRIRPDGSIPDDNSTGTAVYSIGHRNVQGLAFGPGNIVYASELGHRTWDEINVIEAGKDYGWPGSEGTAGNVRTAPLHVVHPDDASFAGMAYFRGSLWVGALRGQRIWQIPVNGKRVSGPAVSHFIGRFGRIRDIEVAPDSSLWVITSNTDRGTWGSVPPKPGDDKLLRIEP